MKNKRPLANDKPKFYYISIDAHGMPCNHKPNIFNVKKLNELYKLNVKRVCYNPEFNSLEKQIQDMENIEKQDCFIEWGENG